MLEVKNLSVSYGAIEAVKDIKSSETSKDNVWSVNTDKSYHEEK